MQFWVFFLCFLKAVRPLPKSHRKKKKKNAMKHNPNDWNLRQRRAERRAEAQNFSKEQPWPFFLHAAAAIPQSSFLIVFFFTGFWDELALDEDELDVDISNEEADEKIERMLENRMNAITSRSTYFVHQANQKALAKDAMAHSQHIFGFFPHVGDKFDWGGSDGGGGDRRRLVDWRRWTKWTSQRLPVHHQFKARKNREGWFKNEDIALYINLIY